MAVILFPILACDLDAADQTHPFAGSARVVVAEDAGATEVDASLDGTPDAEPACEPAAPSDRDTAAALDTVRPAAETLCPTEEAWFTAPLRAGDRVIVVLTDPTEAAALAVWRADGGLLAEGTFRDGKARVTLSATETFPLLVQVHNPTDAPTTFSLAATIEHANPDCEELDPEPNDTTEQALRLDPSDAARPGAICDDAPDLYRVDLEADHTTTVAFAFRHADGDLDVRAWTESPDAPVATSESTADVERVVLGPWTTAQTVWVEIYGWSGATGPYAVTRFDFGPPDQQARASGRVAFEDRRYGDHGFTGELGVEAGRALVVQVVRERDEAVVAEGLSGLDGAFGVAFDAHTGEQYRVRALAVVEVGELSARVVDRSDAHTIYALESGPFEAEGGTDVGRLLAPATGPGGAFNIADVLGQAYRLIVQHTDRTSPGLTVEWQLGQAFGCGSCYGGDRISLGGQLEDPDEYDDDIILHEFGHHFIAHFSRDSSLGGSHRDRLVSPTLAYGEGVAYFLAGMWGGDGRIEDNFIDDGRVADLEAMTVNGEPLPELFGTESGTLSGRQREELVAGVMWDALDDESAEEPFDTVSIGVEGHMRALVDGLGAIVPPANVGPPGVDLSDWLATVACSEGGDLTTWLALADAFAYPWSEAETHACAGKGADRPFVLQRRVGRVWLDAARKDVGAPGWVRLYAGASAIDARKARAVRCDALPCALAAGLPAGASLVITGYLGPQWFGASLAGTDGATGPALPTHTRPDRRGPIRAWPASP